MTSIQNTSYNKRREDGDRRKPQELKIMNRSSVRSAEYPGQIHLAGPIAALLLAGAWLTGTPVSAIVSAAEPLQGAPQQSAAAPAAAEAPPGKDLVPLNKQATVLLDKAGKRILLKGRVVLRQGALELFCCPKQTKEHESILAVDTKAYVIHAGLLALGAKPGKPASFNPTYRAPTGQKIEIFVNWTAADGKQHRVTGQSWVRRAIHRFYGESLDRLPAGLKIPETSELRYDSKIRELSWYGPMTARQRDEFLALSQDVAYQKAIRSFFDRSQSREMTAGWVFAGSGIYKDEETGKEFYLAEEGDLICVANFATAMIDVSLESSAVNEGLLFEAYTERIPPKETAVTIELVPVFEKAGK